MVERTALCTGVFTVEQYSSSVSSGIGCSARMLALLQYGDGADDLQIAPIAGVFHHNVGA